MNSVVDTLSQRTLLLTIMSDRVVGFEAFNDIYAVDPSFGRIIQEVNDGQRHDFILHNG